MPERHYHRHYSPALQRDMEVLHYGYGGAVVVVFPTSRGRFDQWEDFRMIEPLHEPLARGWLQLFCVDGIDNETFYDFEKPVSEVLTRHEAYERYLKDDLWPRLPQGFTITTGTSFGAFHAVHFACRFPHLVQRVVAMSGDFDVSKNLDDRYDPPAYFHNPMAYLGGVGPGPYLDQLRQVDFRIAVGAHDFCLDPSQRLAGLLRALQVPCDFQVWPAHFIHDWPTWRVMARQLL